MKTKQTSQFLRQAPEKLARLIELINLIPPDYELRFPPHLRLDAGLSEESPLTAIIKLGEFVDKYIKTLPSELSDYLLKNELPLTWAGMLEGGSMGRYESFYAARENLRTVAQLAKTGVNRAQIQANMHGALIPSLWMVGVDSSGKVRVTKDLFTEAVEGVEATRIRECEICNRIFWAGRLDQWTCSKSCSGILRTRRWREKYQSDYKLKRNGYKPVRQKRKSTLNKKGR